MVELLDLDTVIWYSAAYTEECCYIYKGTIPSDIMQKESTRKKPRKQESA